MISFKQFLAEKAMNKGAYAKAAARVGGDARIGFEIEVVVPAKTAMHVGPSETKDDPSNIEDIRKYDSLSEFEVTFYVTQNDRAKINRDFGDWVAAQEDDWVEGNWHSFVDDDEHEDNPDRAEKNARREAAREYDKSDDTFDVWVDREFRTSKSFVDFYDLEPNYGWHNDYTVYTSDPQGESEMYMNGWGETAKYMAQQLELIVKNKVVVNGSGYSSWNLTHDTSIKDDQGTDYESGMNGYGIEIVSPPLKFETAFTLLEAVLRWVDRNGMNTNETTGIHMNMSLNDMADFDPLKLVLFMGDKHILEKFNRLSNTFTRSQIQLAADGVEMTGTLPKGVAEIEKAARESLKTSGKYFSVNLNHMPKYLEFRAAGGPGYHKRIADLHELMGRWLTAMEIATDPARERKEYLKKIAKLAGLTSIGKAQQGDSVEKSFKDAVLGPRGRRWLWDGVQKALESGDAAKIKTALKSLVMEIISDYEDGSPKKPTFKQVKEARAMFKQAGVKLNDLQGDDKELRGAYAKFNHIWSVD